MGAALSFAVSLLFLTVSVYAESLSEVSPADFYNIVCSDAGAGTYEAFPDVCLTKSGELLCVFYAGYGHVSHPNEKLPRGARIAMCRSTNFGRSWSEPTVVVDTPIDDRDSSIVQLPNGDLFVTFMTYDPKRKSGTHQVFSVRSKDNGKTWGKSSPIDSPFTQTEAVSTPVRVMPDGRLLLPLYGNNTGDKSGYTYSAVLESTDNGHSWKTIAKIKTDKPLDEPDIVRLPNGDFLVMIRPAMMWCKSTDGGNTWTRPRELGIKGDCPYLLLTSKSILLCGIRQREMKCTSVLYSDDFGKTWNMIVIDKVLGAYPSLVELPDGRIFVVYYTEGKGSDIRCLYLQADSSGVRLLRCEN